MAGQRYRQTQRAVANAAGAASLDFQGPGNQDLVILAANVSAVMPSPSSTTQAAIVCLLNGFQAATTSSGNSDTATGREILRSGDVYSVQFSGCDPGAVCTATLQGIAYPYGTGPAE